MKIVLITYPWFLDFSIEYIKELSSKVELHVIVISQKNNTSSTIFNLDKKFKINEGKKYTLKDFGTNLKDSDFYKPYIKNCKSFTFLFTPLKWRGIKNLKFNLTLRNYIKEINPDKIHFDDLTIEIFWQSFFWKSNKVIINVHDPLPHTGEKNIRRDIVRKLFYPKYNQFITYSKYSNSVFKNNYKKDSHILSLVPYSFYTNYCNINNAINSKEEYILFFGRISEYKGIEDLIGAYKLLENKIKLIIAGKSVYGYNVPKDLIDTNGVIFYNRFIENEELAKLINGAKFIVCPYKDATQSGVVMTSFGFRKKIVVSNVGGLHEPINKQNGIVYQKGNISDLKRAMEYLINNNSTDFMISDNYLVKNNVEKLIQIYKKNDFK